MSAISIKEKMKLALKLAKGFESKYANHAFDKEASIARALNDLDKAAGKTPSKSNQEIAERALAAENVWGPKQGRKRPPTKRTR